MANRLSAKKATPPAPSQGPQAIRPPRLQPSGQPRLSAQVANPLQPKVNNTRLSPATAAPAPSVYNGSDPSMSVGAGATGGGGDFTGDLASLTADSPVVTPDPTTDPQYQEELAALVRSLSDYQNQVGLAKSQYGVGYNDNMRQLGWNNDTGALDANNMQGYYGQALANNTNDYASRGMLTSGLYGESVGDIGTDYNNRAKQFIGAKQSFDEGQDQQLSSYKAQDEASRAAILRNALARITAGITGA